MAMMIGSMAQNNNALYGNKDKAAEGIYKRILNNGKEVTFTADDVQFWCGTGSNQAVIVVGWDDATDPQAIGWGVRWNGPVVAIDLIDSIATYDSRFSYQFGGGLISNVEFSDNGETLTSEYNWWCYYINGDWASGYGAQDVEDGDYLELSGDCSWEFTTATPAVDPNAVIDTTPTIPDATIAHADILHWVGMGENEVVIAVNWNAPDTCLAWGVRFGADTITLKDAMDSIMCKDYRFKYVPGDWGIDEIIFNDYQGTHYSLTDVENFNYWWCNYNGAAADYAYDEQQLVNGDQVKWGDPTCGIVIDTMWGYPSEIVWTKEVSAVPALVSGPFCGAAETEGSTAIHYSDTLFKGWASGCELNLGRTDIADPDAAIVSYGSANDAIGAVVEGNLAVVSLGDGGSATLTFDYPITNGEGYDFAVFENSFNDTFLELAFVEVSTDGEHFVRFPSTSLTSSCHGVGGSGGINPTYIDGLAGKYRTGYGTPFDLEQLRDSANIDIDSIMFVRIVDVVGSIDAEFATYDSWGNMVVDPYPTGSYSSGFDLDGVGVINWKYTEPNIEPEGIDNVVAQQISLYPNPAQAEVTCTVSMDGEHVMNIFDMTGRQLMHTTFQGTHTTINVAALSSGIYMVRIDGQAHRLVIKK